MASEGSAEAFELPVGDLEDLLARGQMEIEGRMADSSNLTLLVTVTDGDRSHRAIYKPHRGERPLWDFPSGLYQREVAAYRLAAALGWGIVPPTALGTGPLGEGSIQAFVDARFEHHYFSLRSEGLGEEDLRAICVFDLLANNTDRKSGHCLWGRDGHVYAIDNGLSFHHQWKLRTVLWDYVGEPIPDDLVADIAALLERDVPPGICALLDPFEVDALRTRMRAIVHDPVFPEDETGGRRWPWPLV
jgi:uncharacterized repeat protein (TIGR03843 family)